MKRLKNDLLYAAVRVLLAIARVLPLATALSAGRALGRLGYHVARGDRRRALRNLALALPELPARERRRLARRSFASLGETAAETALLDRVLARGRVTMSASSRRALDDALAAGRGAIFASAHLGSWELLAAYLARGGVPATVLTRRQYDPRIDALLQARRARAGVRTIDRGPGHRRRIVLALRRGGAVGLLLDQRFGGRPSADSALAAFFGRPAWTPTAPARYAARRAIPLLAGFVRRVGRLSYSIEIARIPPCPEAINRAIETAVRRAPDQWVWLHARWHDAPVLSQIPQRPVRPAALNHPPSTEFERVFRAPVSAWRESRAK